MIAQRLLVLGVLLLPVSCMMPRVSTGLEPRPIWSAPPLERAVSVRDGRTGKGLSFDAFLDALSSAEVVFLGEQHTDETTHRVELAVYEGLLARRGGKVVLALEMFERDVQPDLDAYLAGTLNETAFLSRSRPWGNYSTAYRPLIEMARSSARPVVASNFPAPLRQRVAQEGAAAIAALKGDARREAPTALLPNTPAYWRRADNAIRGHRGMMRSDSDEQRLYSTQSLWDNAMGEACALALEKYPRHSVLHVNGGFHSAYWDGTVRQLLLRRPGTRVLTVDINPVSNPCRADVAGASVADYVVFAETVATEADEGAWSVHVSRPHQYRIHMPSKASNANRLPLVIWLGDDGLTAADGIELWRTRLGEDVAIVVLEPLYPEVQPDLSKGGRWFWPDSFSSDISATMSAVDGVWGYVLRNFPVDPSRVCLAGEGTGATVVAATALLTDRMDIAAVGFEPRHYAKIRDFPLPLPELRGNDSAPHKSLSIIAGTSAQSWWRDELHQYAEIGLMTSIAPAGTDPWSKELDAENALRVAVNIERRPPAATNVRRYILADPNSPRSRQWSRLLALRSTTTENVAVAVVDAAPADPSATCAPTDIRAELFRASGTLPKCPGPFGGTTVVVIPDGTASSEVAAWRALEADDPLRKESRFHRLRIAHDTDEKRLPDVLATLHSEGRENVLIIPATFCADVATMRSLERGVRSFADTMTIQWLPGLGGQLASSDAHAGAPN